MKSAGLALLVGSLCVLLPAAGWSQPRARDGAGSDALTSDTVGAAEAGPSLSPPPSALSIDGNLILGGNVYKGLDRFLFSDKYGNQSLGERAMGSVAPGAGSDGQFNSAFGAETLSSNTTGWSNTAAGYASLHKNTTGRRNTAAGSWSLVYNTTGYSNTALGNTALYYNSTGSFNTAAGTFALAGNTVGSDNVAIGYASAYYSNGHRNTSVGSFSFYLNTTGSNNIALGRVAGYYNTTGSSNIFINSDGVAPGTESHTLRIGEATGTGARELDRAFISGIANAVGGTFSQPVCVDPSTDQLGPCSGPVSIAGEGVANPADASLAFFDRRHAPFSETESRASTPLLLQELDKQRAEIGTMRAKLADQEAELAALRADRVRLDELTARLARLEALDGRREEPALVARR